MVLPTYTCREAVITNAVKASVNGISACAPVDSDVAVTLNVCASEQTIWLAWINQIKVAFCYLFGQVTDILSALITVDTTLDDLQTQIDDIDAQLPPVHVGTPTITAGSAAGGSPTLTLLTGSDDTQGAVDVTLGSAPTAAGGILFTLQFGSNFAAQIFPLACARVSAPLSTAGIFFTTFESANAPVSACAIVSHSPTAAFLAAQSFRVSYRIGYSS